MNSKKWKPKHWKDFFKMLRKNNGHPRIQQRMLYFFQNYFSRFKVKLSHFRLQTIEKVCYSQNFMKGLTKDVPQETGHVTRSESQAPVNTEHDNHVDATEQK